jgi:hypothetical protein
MNQVDTIRVAADRAAATAQLWPAVQQILGVIQSDTELQRIASHLELTRDRVRDDQQRNILFQSVCHRLQFELGV